MVVVNAPGGVNKTTPSASQTPLRTAKGIFYALWRFIASLISSRVALHGNIGSKYTFAVPGVIFPRFGQ